MVALLVTAVTTQCTGGSRELTMLRNFFELASPYSLLRCGAEKKKKAFGMVGRTSNIRTCERPFLRLRTPSWGNEGNAFAVMVYIVRTFRIIYACFRLLCSIYPCAQLILYTQFRYAFAMNIPVKESSSLILA